MLYAGRTFELFCTKCREEFTTPFDLYHEVRGSYATCPSPECGTRVKVIRLELDAPYDTVLRANRTQPFYEFRAERRAGVRPIDNGPMRIQMTANVNWGALECPHLVELDPGVEHLEPRAPDHDGGRLRARQA